MRQCALALAIFCGAAVVGFAQTSRPGTGTMPGIMNPNATTRKTESKGLFGGGLRPLWSNSKSATSKTGFRPWWQKSSSTTASAQKPFLQRMFGK